MTFPFAIDKNASGPEDACAPPDQGGLDPLTATPTTASGSAAFTPLSDAAATAPAEPRMPVAVLGQPDPETRIDPSASDQADRKAARPPGPPGLGWRAGALGVAACLGAAAGSAGLAAIGAFGAAPRLAQAESLEAVRGLKDQVATLRGQLKTVSDNVAALRANFNSATAAVTSQLAKVSDEVEKVERLHSEHKAAVPDNPAPPTPSEAKPAKPAVVEGWVLRSVSDGVAVVEGRHGMIEIEPGDSLPGVGRIHEIKRQDGHWVVVTPKGLIVSAR